MGRAVRDGGFIVLAHAHGDYGQAISIRDILQKPEVNCGVFIDRWNAHHPFDLKAIVIPRQGDQAISIIGQDACLLLFGTGVDLNQHPHLSACLLFCLGDSSGQFFSVQCLDHIEQADRIQSLVGLQWADQAKLQPLSAVRPVALGLLYSVLSENGLSRGQRLNQSFIRLGLADGGQDDIRRLASGFQTGIFDARPHIGKSLLDGRRSRMRVRGSHGALG